MPKFDKRFIHCVWDDALNGKSVFAADDVIELKAKVEESFPIRTYVSQSDEPKLPFSCHGGNYTFVYYDPYYDLKLALEQGQTLQIQTDKNTWEDIEGECDFTIESQYLRVKPLPARITCRELSMWLSSGQGECKADWDTTCQAQYLYREHDADLPVPNGITVRKWHDDVWHIPTKEYIDQEE